MRRPIGAEFGIQLDEVEQQLLSEVGIVEAILPVIRRMPGRAAYMICRALAGSAPLSLASV